ncbi:hypothetical protein J4573_09285 [Actinomadura barringtoniae]|uniref:Uncharacterized protein n=1 Tax=Actinomadura barringtoniae TaxID=1427535 RepID=A0A939T1C4_9ACTN|nr:hypothetical protein [Actinomadura barringtoniae]MBO2447276.1 hypothetical protein [Actinomadura barringtoniae]
MSGSWFEVRPQSLLQAEAGAGAVGGRVQSSVGSAKNGSHGAISIHAGWESSAALQQCLTAWEARLQALSSEIKQLQTGLGSASREYSEAERKAAALAEHVAGELREGRG